IRPQRFYRCRNRVHHLDGISGPPFGRGICRQGSGFESVRDRNWKGDGLAQHRHPQKDKRRTVFGFFRTGAGACGKTRNHVCAHHIEPYRSSRNGVRCSRNLSLTLGRCVLQPRELFANGGHFIAVWKTADELFRNLRRAPRLVERLAEKTDLIEETVLMLRIQFLRELILTQRLLWLSGKTKSVA